MAIITIPAGLVLGTFDIGQQRYDITEMAETTGKVRIRIGPPPRWTVKIGPPTGPGFDQTQGGLWKGLTLALQGGVNHLAVYDVARPAPLGTLRGTLTLSGSVSAGATQLTVSGGNGGTVKAGDSFQIGTGLSSQLVVASEDGTATFKFGAPLRTAFNAGTAVTWDKPVMHCRIISDQPNWAYQAGNLLMTGGAIDLIEDWEI